MPHGLQHVLLVDDPQRLGHLGLGVVPSTAQLVSDALDPVREGLPRLLHVVRAHGHAERVDQVREQAQRQQDDVLIGHDAAHHLLEPGVEVVAQRALHGHRGLARHGQLVLRGTLFLSLKELGRDHLAVIAESVRVLSAMHGALGVRGHDVGHVLGLELGERRRVGRVDEGELAVLHSRVPRGEA